jgi:ribosomal-protein-alanine N-acetyltransferase
MILGFDNFEIAPIKETDAWKLCDFMIINEDRLKAYFPKTLEQNLTPDLSRLFTEKKVKAFEAKEEFLFTLKEVKTRQLAGLIYIKELNWSIKQGEFAYALSKDFSGQLLMSKAIKILTQYAFEVLGLEALQIIVNKDNLSSIKVALNNEFIWKETRLKAYTPPNSAPLDMELYELYK